MSLSTARKSSMTAICVTDHYTLKLKCIVTLTDNAARFNFSKCHRCAPADSFNIEQSTPPLIPSLCNNKLLHSESHLQISRTARIMTWLLPHFDIQGNNWKGYTFSVKFAHRSCWWLKWVFDTHWSSSTLYHRMLSLVNLLYLPAFLKNLAEWLIWMHLKHRFLFWLILSCHWCLRL